MEIKLPYKWIKEYLQTDLEPKDFAKIVSLYGPSIEKAEFDTELNDYILEIETTPNRVDIASVIGMAREAGAILKSKFTFKKPEVSFTTSEVLPFSINIQDFERCRRFSSVIIKNVKVGHSPEFIQQRLEACGINSINIIVDITNYVLLEYGQPMHAYDYHKLEGNQINVRLAKDGETILLLGDSEPTKLDSDDLVIADENSPVCIAGVKGGEKSGITSETTTVVLEAANFHPIKTRRTARRHAMQTDASSLFEKDLPPEQTEFALMRAVELILQHAGGEIVSEVFDIKEKNSSSYLISPQREEKRIVVDQEKESNRKISYDYSLTKKMLGIEISKAEVIDIMTRLGFFTTDKGDCMLVSVPYFRANDIKFDYDIVEEIARIYGYQNIPSKLPETQIPVVKTASILKNENKVREILSSNGLTEVFTYSLISKKHLEIAGIQPEQTIEISNPLSMDYQFMRTELASEMLMISKRNQGFRDEIRIFEISNVYIKVSDTDLPIERSTLSMLVAGSNFKTVFYELKGYFELVLQMFGIDINKFSYKNETLGEPYAIGKSAGIYFDSKLIGKIGIASENAVDSLGLKKQNAILEVNFEELSKIIDSTVTSYTPIPKFPSVQRDLSFIVPRSVQWSQVREIVKTTAGEVLIYVELFDVFEDDKLGKDKKSIAFRMEFQNMERTMEDEEVAEIINKITQAIEVEVDGVVR